MERDRFQSVASERAILVRVILPDDAHEENPLSELEGLATTAGVKIVGRVTQRRESPDGGTFLGKGKVAEVKLLAEANDADVVLLDNELSPGQIRNLEKEFGVKVIDRTELILDIFATHAQTAESRLAVELAQLEYSLPRLKRMWTHLSRIKMGVGMRGPGEKQLEVDRRLAEKRIFELKQDLLVQQRRKEQQVQARFDHMTVSLVGYTNAGKSTLMNALTGAGVLAADKLFATLDTRTRRWMLPNWGPVLLSDTVGFIRNLPHHLIASFKATLEEARCANLLLHVADASNPAVLEQISAVYKVLEDLEIEQKDTLLVLNKIDANGAADRLGMLQSRYPNAIPVSAFRSEGLTLLAAAVSDALSRAFLDLDIETGVENGRLMAFLAAHGEVLSRTFHENRVVLHCRLLPKYLGQIEGDGATVRKHELGGNGAVLSIFPADREPIPIAEPPVPENGESS